MKKPGFNGYVYDFSVDYYTTDVDDIKDIHKYLLKKNCKWRYLDLLDLEVFSIGLTILSGLTNVSSLSCISMNNQECKTKPQLLIIMEMNL